jgi:TonB family protein
MRKTTFVRTLYFCFILFCLIAFVIVYQPAFAQNATATATPAAESANETPASAMPSDPKELMLLAAKTNGLIGDDIKPWHLKASYTVLDENSRITDEGSYEEFYVSPTKYKRSYIGTTYYYSESGNYKRSFPGVDYKYSVYGTEKGVLFSGDQNKQFAHAFELRREFIEPLPDPQSVEQNSYFSKQLAAGGVKLTCVSLKDANGNPYGPNWCFDMDAPLLRVGAPSPGLRSLHNGILSFQGRSISGDLKFVQQDRLAFTAHLNSIEAIASIDEALFLPPADATPVKPVIVKVDPPKKVTIAGGVMAGKIIKKVQPVYPLLAKDEGITGTVVLQATIGKDGRIENLRVISGPLMLQEAAMDAVKDWIYSPTLLAGEPVAVETTINVIFTLVNRR